MMNDSAKFKEVPEKQMSSLPFKLDEQSLSDWLISLASCDAEQACSQILYAVQGLNRLDISVKTKFVFLKLINEYLSPCINRLKGACWDSGFPLTEEENTYVQLVVWNQLTLAEGFFSVATAASKKNDSVLALAMTLQTIGQAQLHMAAVYVTPSNGFWQRFYQVFAWAEQKQYLHLPIESNDMKGLTLNTLFARCLVFQSCDTNQFNARDIRTIFNFLPKVCVDLVISHHSDELDLFMFDLESDVAPHNVNSQLELGSGLVRYFSPIQVANAINQIIKGGKLWMGTLKSINNDLFSRVVKTLQLKQKRRYNRKKEEHNLLGVIGFEDIVAFLYKIGQSTLVIPQPTPKNRNTNMTLDKLTPYEEVFGTTRWEIEKKEDNNTLKAKLAEVNKHIWTQSQNVAEISIKKVALKDIKVSDSSANGYSVSWNQMYSKAKIGDLFGIISEDKKRLEIAIIRRIALKTGNDFRNDFRFGAELLGFESEVIYLSKERAPEVGALAVFIPGIEALKRPNAVIYSAGKFAVGEHVYLHYGSKTVLSLLVTELHSTTSISHVEVVFVD